MLRPQSGASCASFSRSATADSLAWRTALRPGCSADAELEVLVQRNQPHGVWWLDNKILSALCQRCTHCCVYVGPFCPAVECQHWCCAMAAIAVSSPLSVPGRNPLAISDSLLYKSIRGQQLRVYPKLCCTSALVCWQSTRVPDTCIR